MKGSESERIRTFVVRIEIVLFDWIRQNKQILNFHRTIIYKN